MDKLKPGKHKNSAEAYAREQHGNSRVCETCPCRHDPFTKEFHEKVCIGICAEMYVKGFKKGIVYQRTKQKEKQSIND